MHSNHTHDARQKQKQYGADVALASRYAGKVIVLVNVASA
jgi:glutathione peroxidase-family protein